MRRFKPVHALFLLLLSAANLFAGEIENFENHWIHRALTLQRGLDMNAPLSQSTFIGTHNSYNASAYSNLGSYWDPNQVYNLRDQLRMGIRAMELDVHAYFSTDGWPWEWGYELLLSHAQDNHVGASTFDRTFAEGLSEIMNWLNKPENSNEILLIYIEEHVDNEFNEAVDIINRYMGSKVYRPASGGCEGVPMDISKNDLLAAGKQIIIITDGCHNNNFNSWVFGGMADLRNGYPTGSVANFRNYPDCGGSFGRGDYDNYILRYYEDRTTLSDIFGNPGEPITPNRMRELLRCGVNMPGMDKVEPFDGRLNNAVWSWASNEPNDYGSGEDCAESRSDGRFNDMPCATIQPSACRNPDTGEWYVTNQSVSWTQAAATCAQETGGDFVFDVPQSGYDNELLKEAKAAQGASRVWLNYSDRSSEGFWNAGNHGQSRWAGAWSASGGRSAVSTANPAVGLIIEQAGSVQINLTSSQDTYLYLLDVNGNTIALDDDGGSGYNSRLNVNLGVGEYTIIAATYHSGVSGSWSLTTSNGSLTDF